MDINALLSPDDGNHKRSSAVPTSKSTATSPRRGRPALNAAKRSASGLSQEITRSPDRGFESATATPSSVQAVPLLQQQQLHTQSFNHHPGAIAVTNFRPLPTSNPGSAPASPHTLSEYGQQHSHHHHPHQQQQQQQQQQQPVIAHRPSATPQAETLSGEGAESIRDQNGARLVLNPGLPDVASIQQRQQPVRVSSGSSIRSEVARPPLRSALSNAAPPIARSISHQSLADLTMAEGPAQTPPPRDFTSSALSPDESKTVMELLGYLAENSYAYLQHVQLINLLHKGFLRHVCSAPESDAALPPPDPHSYALLAELRQAREAMDTRFAVGEAIWSDWLSDEILLVTTNEDRINLTSLFQKALADEPASVRIWLLWLDWFSSTYKACFDLHGADNRGWTAEDKEICKELFDRQELTAELAKAEQATRWRIDESHLVWNRYAEVIQEDCPQDPNDEDIVKLHKLFVERLRTPHVTRDETMSMYWPIVSRFEGGNYEAVIEHLNWDTQDAKLHTDLRSKHELKLKSAIESADQDSVASEFEKYIRSEKFHHKNPGKFDYDLRCALYERALLRFPTATEWWIDYVDYVVAEDLEGTQNLVPLIERATRHCPWSGDLWGRRILRQDVEQQPRQEVENTKHRATNSGLADVGGMEELVKMLQQWCSYLRRLAFKPTATEDDLDTAEVGILAALEDVRNAGRQIYGDSYQHDPLFRLEKIQIKFLGEARRLDEARTIYRELVPSLGHFFDFWHQWFHWELWLWGFDRIREPRRIETPENGPALASDVVREALRQRNLDWPEKVLEMYLSHFQQHESGAKLAEALIEAREFANRLAFRRAKEAEEAAAQQQQIVSTVQEAEAASPSVPMASSTEKRKREDEQMRNGESHKKARTIESETGETRNEMSASTEAYAKRDREHTTITLKNLPAHVQEIDIKKFFRDCGLPRSVNILRDEASETASATIEFESHEDVLAAKTRNGKLLDGREIHIQSGDQNTLYVTNYPAEWDEKAIRSLFKTYGEVVSVRFPSLKYNSRRRFCYVQFLTGDIARTAERSLDGKKLDSQHTLVAKVSDPDAKRQRSSPQSEGREVFVRNMDREASEAEVRRLFTRYGNLEKVNLLRLSNGKLTGTGFLVFSSTDEATSVVENLDKKPFRDRILQVSLSDPKGRAAPHERAKKEDLVVKKPGGNSATPEIDPERGSKVSIIDDATGSADGNYQSAKQRKAAIFDVPDTVNDARIRSTMEQYGTITKIQLRRELGGAIVEFEDAKSAFNVKMGVNVGALGSEARTGDVGDFLAQKRKKLDATTGSSSKGPSASSALAFVPPAASRSGQSHAGRRGGLGSKKGGFNGLAKVGNKTSSASNHAEGSRKSNSDFRSMLEASKKRPDASADQNS